MSIKVGPHLVVRMITTGWKPEGVPLLCNADGSLLPGQTDVVIDSPMNEVTRITVTFIVDGQHVLFEDGRPVVSQSGEYKKFVLQKDGSVAEVSPDA